MEDKTPIYMLVIVAIVAVVGIIVMMTNSAPVPDTNMMTGNAVLDQAPSVTLFGKMFFIVFLFGVAGYMYFSKQE